MIAICVRCGKEDHPTNIVDDGGKLLMPHQYQTQTMNQHGIIANAICWRCDREERAAAMRCPTP